MAFITYQEYELYFGVTLAAAEQTLLTNSLIPEVEGVIEKTTGIRFIGTGVASRKFNPLENASNGRRLFFNEYAYSITTVLINGVTITFGDWLPMPHLETDPSDGVILTAASGLSFLDYGDTPENSIEITANWGYSSTLPTDINRACMIYIQGKLKNRGGTKEDWESREFFSILDEYAPFRPFG